MTKSKGSISLRRSYFETIYETDLGLLWDGFETTWRQLWKLFRRHLLILSQYNVSWVAGSTLRQFMKIVTETSPRRNKVLETSLILFIRREDEVRYLSTTLVPVLSWMTEHLNFWQLCWVVVGRKDTDWQRWGLMVFYSWYSDPVKSIDHSTISFMVAYQGVEGRGGITSTFRTLGTFFQVLPQETLASEHSFMVLGQSSWVYL